MYAELQKMIIPMNLRHSAHTLTPEAFIFVDPQASNFDTHAVQMLAHSLLTVSEVDTELVSE